ncbi:MAG: hypothetical protein OEW22_09640, partial [Rubrivivax sp.]|nr:hypothetical protein [Rubrivivax sp.]
MRPLAGWGLAIAGLMVGAWQHGWRGVAVAFSAIVLWLLLQFSLAARALRAAGQRPVGRVDSAVMLQSQLRRGMPLRQVLLLARSLGRRVGDDPERWHWADAGGAELTIELRG